MTIETIQKAIKSSMKEIPEINTKEKKEPLTEKAIQILEERKTAIEEQNQEKFESLTQ